jgi:hypothetical protein
MMTDGRTHCENVDAEMSAVWPSLGAEAGEGHDLSQVQVTPVGESAPETETVVQKSDRTWRDERHAGS